MRLTGFLLLLGLALPPPLMASDGRVAAIATPGTVWDRHWGEFREKATAAGFDFDYFVNGQLGSEEAMLSALRRGRVQFGGFSLEGLASTVPELTVAMTPFLFDSLEQLDYVYDTHLTQAFAPLFAERGLALLGWVEVGWVNIFANQPIRLPEDLRNLKTRGAPNIGHQTLLRLIGADAVSVQAGDLVPALQTGLVEAGLMGTIPHLVRTSPFTSHFTLARVSFDTGALVANKRWYDSLTPEQQRALGDSFPPAERARADVRAFVDQSRAALEAQGEILIELSEQERAQWQAFSAPVQAEIIDQLGPEAASVLEAINTGKAAFAAQSSE